MIIPLEHYLVFGLLIFLAGIYGALTRRNVIGILLAIELILNAVNINLIVFSKSTALEPGTGQLFAFFIIALAAAGAATGLAIVLALYRIRKTVYTDEVHLLKW